MLQNQFNKIKLLDSIANSLVSYGVNSGNIQLGDYVDLNCGAVPEGEFSQIIDPEAPHQFLSLYTTIAEKRFAFAVTELIRMNPALEKSIEDFMFSVGKDMGITGICSAEQAFEVVKSMVLDGMPCDETKKVTVCGPDKVEWEKLCDSHKEAWDAAGGNLEVYYKMQASFVNGLLDTTEYYYLIEGCSKFSLCHK